MCFSTDRVEDLFSLCGISLTTLDNSPGGLARVRAEVADKISFGPYFGL